MSELVLVRHAQASFGSDDYDRLSPLGHQQALWLAEYFTAHELRFDHVVRGDLRRHRETVEPLCALLDLPNPEVDARFDEFHYDALQDAYIANTNQAAAANRDDFLAIFPSIFAAWKARDLDHVGESFREFDNRTKEGLEAAFRTGGRTLVVTSGGVIGVTLARVLGLDTQATTDLLLNIHNASVHRLIFEAGRLRLSLFNASPHLDGAGRTHARTYV